GAEHGALAISPVAPRRAIPLHPGEPDRPVPHPPPEGRGATTALRAQRPRGARAAGSRGTLVPRPLPAVVLCPRRRPRRACDLPHARPAAPLGVRPLPLRAGGEARARAARRRRTAPPTRAGGGRVRDGSMNNAQREPGRMRRGVKAVRTTLNMPVKYATYATARSAGPIYPDRIYVESTNHCNLKCIMCPTGLGVIRRPEGYMAMDL